MNHIKITNDENRSWCGKTLGTEFFYKDAEQAALGAIYGTKTVCGDCVDTVIDCLQRNRCQLESES